MGGISNENKSEIDDCDGGTDRSVCNRTNELGSVYIRMGDPSWSYVRTSGAQRSARHDSSTDDLLDFARTGGISVPDHRCDGV